MKSDKTLSSIGQAWRDNQSPERKLLEFTHTLTCAACNEQTEHMWLEPVFSEVDGPLEGFIITCPHCGKGYAITSDDMVQAIMNHVIEELTDVAPIPE